MQSLCLAICNSYWHCLHGQVIPHLHIIHTNLMRRVRNILPELRHMEHIMQIRKIRWQRHPISNLSYSVRYLIWTNKARSKFLRFQCSSNTGYWCNPQEYMFTFLKFQTFPPLVVITLLSTLGSLHFFTDKLHLLGGFSN